MTKSVTITARITPALAKKLAAYAKAAERSKSQAIEIILGGHIDDEMAFVEAVNVGIKQLAEGRGIPHEEVMRRLRAKSARYRRALRKKAA